ncbi:hypothetical protein [Arthrobacter mobilis]|uniref:STAS domain-containing protein n=1 Tax=Arthrobacter mobilis TaxID=2724944 RepID=A0A7X6K554_9MICC|nr:hypothetical protein [Arthrobacter mobilis]NKX53063.1 hypothetical protein [Arthrobacter mobilis]
MNGKLKVLVRVDLEGSAACISVGGPVTSRNVHALYSLAKRANSLAAGLEITIDLSAAQVEPAVLDELQACAGAQRLPASADPAQAGCRLRVVAGAASGSRTAVPALAG